MSDLCIVLRTVNYKDSDKILTLFSREHGRISAQARGARQAKSTMAAATQPFCCAEYEFYERVGKRYVRNAAVKEGFFDIQNNYEKYSAACVLLELTDRIADEVLEGSRLFARLANTLYALEKNDTDPRRALIYYFLHVIDLTGIFPALDFCATCGDEVASPAFFSSMEGGVVCERCAAHVQRDRIKPETVRCLDMLGKINPADVRRLVPDADVEQLLNLLSKFLTLTGEVHLKTLDFFTRNP